MGDPSGEENGVTCVNLLPLLTNLRYAITSHNKVDLLGIPVSMQIIGITRLQRDSCEVPEGLHIIWLLCVEDSSSCVFLPPNLVEGCSPMLINEGLLSHRSKTLDIHGESWEFYCINHFTNELFGYWVYILGLRI